MVSLFVSVVAGSVALAATNVSGVISADTTWSASQSPYLITADVTVSASATLTIEAGTTVYVSPASNLIVSAGGLKAKGTSQTPILITSQKIADSTPPAAGDWGQLRFLAGTVAAKTILEHVRVEYGSGVVVNGSAPVFNYLDIRNHQGAAVTVDLAASPSGVGNSASGNQLNAIAVPVGDITGTVTWGLRGIPYLVDSGIVSVGASPKVTTVTPNTVAQGATTVVTLSGTRLTGVANATFSNTGLTGTPASGGTATLAPISVVASSSATLGATDLTLLVDAGEIFLPAVITVVPPALILSSVTPNSVYAGHGATSVDVAGSNLTSSSEVLVNNVANATTFVNSSLLRFTLANQASGGTLSIKARAPDPLNAGQYLFSNAVNLSAVTPQLTLSPSSAQVQTATMVPFTVGIPFAAPAGGYTVNLATGSTAVATVPASVVIPQGANSASFNLSGVGNGNTTLTVSHSGATSKQSTINVVPPQSVTLLPSLVLINPNGAGNSVTLKIGYAAAIDYQFSLSTDDPSVATVNPASVTVPAGQTSVTASIAGIANGNTLLHATSSSGPVVLEGSWPVYAASDVTGTLTVDGAALPLSLAPGQKAKITFAGTNAQLLGLVVGSMSTTPAGGSLTIYVDKPDGTNVATCPFNNADDCHLNALTATGTYTLRVVPNSVESVSLSLQLATELTGVPTSGPVGPIVTPSIGVVKGADVQSSGQGQPVVSVAVGVVKGTDAQAGSDQSFATLPVGITKGLDAPPGTSQVISSSPIGVRK